MLAAAAAIACDGAAVPSLLDVAGFSVQGPGFAVRVPELRLEPGRVGALYGPSGCGKSTLLAALFGLLRRDGWSAGGRVAFEGRALAAMPAAERAHCLRHDVTFLMQDAHAALDPLQPVGTQIEQATWQPRAQVVAALQQLGIGEAAALCERLPHQISGGQAQRVLLAIAFLRQSKLVVADEPSASLDGGNYSELLNHLRALVGNGSAVLMATHDLRLLRDLGAAVLVAKAGSFEPGEPEAAPWPPRSTAAIGSVPLLAARGLHVAYGERVVLGGVDFVLHRGEIVAIVGESGAGKTTLARVLAGHRRPDRGEVTRPPRAAAVQLVCQDAQASLTPGRRLRGLLAEASAPYFDAGAGMSSVQLPAALLDSPVARMSGGERRRAALLRAIAVAPDVLVLDEPTASLDRAAAVTVMATLLTLQRSRGLALVLVTHDHELARTVAHRIVAVEGGRLCEVC